MGVRPDNANYALSVKGLRRLGVMILGQRVRAHVQPGPLVVLDRNHVASSPGSSFSAPGKTEIQIAYSQSMIKFQILT
jgi:hypothetical protein